MKIFEGAQLSNEWWEVRRGVPTASEFDRILTPATQKPSASQDEFIAELISDLICQNPNYFTEKGTPVNNYAIQNGKNQEPDARRWYAMNTDLPVRQVMFCKDDSDRFGCSPDALVGDDGALELKVPLAKTHALYLLKQELPREYKCQVHGTLIVTGRKWVDFCSYNSAMQPFKLRVTPDQFTEALKEELDRFWVKYQDMLASLKRAANVPEVSADQAMRLITDDEFRRLEADIERRVLDFGRMLTWANERYHLDMKSAIDLRQLRLMDFHDLIGVIGKKPLKSAV